MTGPGLPAYGAVYGFVADSDLVSQIAYKSDSSTTVASTIPSFDSTRDLITSIENKWGATSVSKYEYTNDALGRRTSVTVSGSAFNTTGTTGFDLFTYNDRNELATARRYTGGTLENPTNPVYTRHFGYDYDPIGNRESYQIGQGTATTYTANQLNQYTATADPSESFTHDDDGNLTQDGTYTYVWDAENRLIEAYPTNPTTGSQKCVMTYDYMNRRVQRSLYNWTGSAWAGSYSSSRIFVYDRWNNLIAYNLAGGLSAFRKNTWGLDLSGLNGNAGPGGIHGAGGIAGLIGSTVANALPPPSYICFYDANGNLSETIKSSDGTLYSHHEYDPWGKQLVKYESAGIAHPFRYSTKYSDGLFEKYYYGYRYSDTAEGRWSNVDPLYETGFIASAPLRASVPAFTLYPSAYSDNSVDLNSLNLYRFVLNAPTSGVDPRGLALRIKPVGHFVLGHCGLAKQDYRWEFEEEDKIPCDGYIIQEVIVNLQCFSCETKHKCIGKCRGGGINRLGEFETLRDGDIRYWEAAGPIAKGLKGGNTIIPGDLAHFRGLKKTYGHYSQRGTAKYFCRDVVGDLSQSGWKAGALHTSARCPQSTMAWSSGSFPHTQTEPAWWTMGRNVEALGETSRWVNSIWDCCCSNWAHTDGDANPRGTLHRQG